MDAAWKRFQGLIDGMLPHEATQQLHDFCVPEDIIEEMVRRHETATAKIATLEEPLALGRENALRWYAGPRADDKNWPAYEKRVLRMLGTDQAKKIDEASDRIVAMIDHPATPSFRSRGLVLGHVQSGKTSNFNAVVCKAADRGYRMFIILSGVTNSLRRQTQTRLIRDLVDLNPPCGTRSPSPSTTSCHLRMLSHSLHRRTNASSWSSRRTGRYSGNSVTGWKRHENSS